MTEHIAFLEKELDKLGRRLEQVALKPNVTAEEIAGLERKIRIKSDILRMLNGEDVSYAVYTKMQASEYAPSPEFVRYSGWHGSLDAIQKMYERACENRRFACVKIVMRAEAYVDLDTYYAEGEGEHA